MKKIFKYPINLLDLQTIEMPEGAKIIHAGHDPMGQLCIWAEVNPSNRMDYHEVFLFGTGHEIVEAVHLRHISTFIDGPFVWHVYGRK